MKSIQHIDIQIGRLAVNLPDWKKEMCFRKASKTRLQIGNKLGTRGVGNLSLGIYFQSANRAIGQSGIRLASKTPVSFA